MMPVQPPPHLRPKGSLQNMALDVIAADYDIEMPAVNEKVDVCSFGILMWELLTGEVPYKDLSHKEIERGVAGGVQPMVPD